MYRVTVDGQTYTAGDLTLALTMARVKSESEALPWTIEWNPDE